MATCILDYSPIDSLQKMVDTIPVNNVKSSGSEEKKKKKLKKQKKETIAPPSLPPPSTLPQLQTTSDFRPNELLKEMGFDISPTNSSTSAVSPTTTAIVDEKQYDLNSCLFHPCKFGECPPFLQFSPKVTICFKVIYFLTTRSH